MSLRTTRRSLTLTAALATALSVTAPLSAGAAPGVTPLWDRATPTTQSAFAADPLPTVQVDGIVWTVEARNGTAYAGGEFAQARPAGAAPGTQQTPRGNLLAMDLATGELRTDFVANTNGRVHDIAVTDDGSTVLVVGEFTTVNGVARTGFAALDARTGQVLDLDLKLDRPARAVTTHGDTLYLGGTFSQVKGQGRAGVAAVSLSTGQVLPFQASVPGGGVYTMVTSPDGSILVIGGQFTSVSGQSLGGVARLDARTGAVLPTPIAALLRTGGERSGVYGLDADERGFYVGGWKWNVVQGFEGLAAANWDGTLRWMTDCHGDTEGVWSSGDQVHAVGHPYSCATVGGMPERVPEVYHGTVSFTNEVHGTTTSTEQSRSYLDYGGLPAPRQTSFDPAIAAGDVLGQSTHAIDGAGDYMVVGGEFPAVQGVPQQGLVRFARRGVAPGTQGPEQADLALRATDIGASAVQLLVTPTWDRDDATLAYRLTQAGRVVDERQVASSSWAREDYVVMDTAAGAGAYTLTVTDPDGNTVSVQAVRSDGAGEPTVYARGVIDSGARQLWSDGAGKGSEAGSLLPGLTDEGALHLRSGAQKVPALLGQGVALNGVDQAYATSGEVRAPRFDVSVELWVKAAPGTPAGRLLGFGPQADGDNARNDRLLYLDQAGHVRFGTWVPQASRVLTSPAAVTDGKWHHVVGTVDAVGNHRLSVDGAEVDSGVFPTGALPVEGRWRVGRDSMALWPDAPDAASTTAVVDSAAVYERVLSPQEIAGHRTLGARQGTANTLENVAGVTQFRFTDTLGGGLTTSLSLPGVRPEQVFVGDWNGDGIDDVGYRTGNMIHLVDRSTETTTSFPFGRPGDEVYVGDWNGDGKDTVALRRGNLFYVTDSTTSGTVAATMLFGRPDDQVLVGDWDGDGKDSLGVRRGNVYYMQNTFRGGRADEEMTFGRAGDQHFVGDWNADGVDSVALRRGSTVFASDDFHGGNAPTEFSFGRADDVAFTGDWSGTGVDGMMLGRGNTYYVADRLVSGNAHRSFAFPTPDPDTAELLVGEWGTPAGDSLAIHTRP